MAVAGGWWPASRWATSRILGVKLGVAAVLFSALAFGQLGLSIDPLVLNYFSNFALVLFVYALGLQLGPGFVASLKADGLRLNLLAVAVVGLGAVMTAGLIRVAHLPPAMAAGLYSGAFNVTPALAAGQEAIRNVAAARGLDVAVAVGQTNLAYSASAPFGLIAPILTIVAFRVLFRANPGHELQHLRELERHRRPARAIVDVEVLKPGRGRPDPAGPAVLPAGRRPPGPAVAGHRTGRPHGQHRPGRGRRLPRRRPAGRRRSAGRPAGPGGDDQPGRPGHARGRGRPPPGAGRHPQGACSAGPCGSWTC